METILYCQNPKCKEVLTRENARFCSEKCNQDFFNLKHQNYAAQRERGVIRKLELVKIMGGACGCCGYNKNLAALEFHHKDPSVKDSTITLRTLANNNWNYILKESEKCELLCANCHREYHNPLMEMKQLKESTEVFSNKLPKSKTMRLSCPRCGESVISSDLECNSCEKKLRRQASLKCACGNVKTSNSNQCQTCYINKIKLEKKDRPQSRIVERPLREVLYQMVLQKPLEEIGRDYGLSGNAIKRWCKSYGIVVVRGVVKS